MAQLARSELSRAEASPDVAALIDSARLRKHHATARYTIQFGAAEVGAIESTVSGGQLEGQLLYTLKGEIGHPFTAKISGFARADWDRHPERFVLEATWSGEKHRVEGRLDTPELKEATRLAVHYTPPQPGATARDFELQLEDRPQLAPGALPLPALSLPSGGTLHGTTDAALTGQSMPWTLTSSAAEWPAGETEAIPALRHQAMLSAFEATLWTDAEGLPLQVDLPFGLMLRRQISEPIPPEPGPLP